MPFFYAVGVTFIVHVNFVLPPYSNTGVVNTATNFGGAIVDFNDVLRNGLCCSIDWLSFTIERYVDLWSCLSEFGFSQSDFYDAPRGANGYRKMLLYYGFPIRVLYDGNDNMGIHIDVSGSAVSEFYRVYYESTFNVETPWGTLARDMELNVVKTLFQQILRIGHMTRLDLSIDNRDLIYYDLDELHRLLSLGRFCSKFRTWKFVEEKETSGLCTGRTIYLGSRSSDVMIRIYDKKLEQNKKYKDAPERLIESEWVRWELELKNDRANRAVKSLIDGMSVGSLAVGILSNYFRIIYLDDTNKSRCSTSIKWLTFTDGIEALSLYVPPIDSTLEEKRAWLLRQCAPTIAAIIMAQGGDLSFLSECLDLHAMRMNPKLRSMVTAANPDWLDQLHLFQGL